eukprot:c12411_g1_i1.p1 GENE.c12411_g1_i1~~c12411_g1_i1.p1  ORF type:complete len:201 (+),score=31.59 c12411_g1_i1:679-1281(+)
MHLATAWRWRHAIPLAELVAAVIYQLAHGTQDRGIEDVFEISHAHFSKANRHILLAIISALHHSQYSISFASTHDQLALEEEKWCCGNRGVHDNRFVFLKDCVSAGDCSLSRLLLHKDFAQERWRCRKGYTAQNLVAFISFSHQLQFFWCGGDGCAYDGTLLHWAGAIEKIPGVEALVFSDELLLCNHFAGPIPLERVQL